MDKIKYNISTQWDFFSAIRRNEVLIHDTTWVNFKSVMLNNRSQTHEGHILYDSVYVKHPEKGESVES